MNALAIDRSNGKGRGRTAACRPCGMGSRHAPIDHREVPPARSSSRAPTGRRFAVGRFYSDPAHVREVMALEHSGLLPEVIRAVVEFFPERQVAAADPLHQSDCQVPDAAEVVHVPASKVAVRYVPTRSEVGGQNFGNSCQLDGAR